MLPTPNALQRFQAKKDSDNINKGFWTSEKKTDSKKCFSPPVNAIRSLIPSFGTGWSWRNSSEVSAARPCESERDHFLNRAQTIATRRGKRNLPGDWRLVYKLVFNNITLQKCSCVCWQRSTLVCGFMHLQHASLGLQRQFYLEAVVLIYLWLVNSACRALWHVNLLRSETADLYRFTCTAVISWIISLCTCHHGSLLRASRGWLLKSPTQTLSKFFFFRSKLLAMSFMKSSLWIKSFLWLRPLSCGKGASKLLRRVWHMSGTFFHCIRSDFTAKTKGSEEDFPRQHDVRGWGSDGVLASNKIR